MKSKLQVKQPDGRWLWVAGMHNLYGLPITTTSKRQAMPEQTYWCVNSIGVARKHCPGHTFRLAASLED